MPTAFEKQVSIHKCIYILTLISSGHVGCFSKLIKVMCPDLAQNPPRNFSKMLCCGKTIKKAKSSAKLKNVSILCLAVPLRATVSVLLPLFFQCIPVVAFSLFTCLLFKNVKFPSGQTLLTAFPAPPLCFHSFHFLTLSFFLSA